MSSMFLSVVLERELTKAVTEVTREVVERCASEYNFSAEEALRMLGMVSIKKVSSKSSKKVVSEKKAKAAFPMPYNGEFSEECCRALRQNNGLYTQCQSSRGESDYCKSCSKNGAPEYGTIQQRRECGIFEYVDPKGRKPVAYAKVMKKYKLTQEQVMEEAGKLNININQLHFEAKQEQVKRGRPASNKEKVAKEAKGAKGRPKKSKKVIQIEGETDDLFASLVASASEEEVIEEEVIEELVVEEAAPAVEVVVEKKAKAPKKSDEEKEAAKLEKESKAAAKLLEKDEKEAAKLLEKEEKEAEKLLEKAKAQQEKEAAKLLEKEQKAAEKAEKEAAKLSKKEKPVAKIGGGSPPPKDDEEQDVVKKIEIDGKKYLKSKKTGIIYDYTEYTKNGEQVVVGKWNESKNKIDFIEVEEESEDEYEEEE